jgi:hypothetical protein
MGTVVLRAGTYYLAAPIVLTAAHSGLTITNYPNEHAEISGGKLLEIKWASATANTIKNSSISTVSSGDPSSTPPVFDVFQNSDAVFGRARAGASSGDTVFLGQ